MECTIEDTKWPQTLFDDEESREGRLHLSAVIDSLMVRSGLQYKGDGFTDMELTAEIGLLWEKVLCKVMRDKYATRPPHVELDGIWMAPDGIGPDPLGVVPMVLEEYKATWRSVKRSPTDDFKWMAQSKSYCSALGTTVAIFRIFHLMGDYKGSGPIYRVARVEYTEWELKQNWDMVLREKQRMEEDHG